MHDCFTPEIVKSTFGLFEAIMIWTRGVGKEGLGIALLGTIIALQSGWLLQRELENSKSTLDQQKGCNIAGAPLLHIQALQGKLELCHLSLKFRNRIGQVGLITFCYDLPWQ
jgi:hypothetical protein